MKSFTCPRIPEIYEWLLLCPNPGKELMPMGIRGHPEQQIPDKHNIKKRRL